MTRLSFLMALFLSSCVTSAPPKLPKPMVEVVNDDCMASNDGKSKVCIQEYNVVDSHCIVLQGSWSQNRKKVIIVFGCSSEINDGGIGGGTDGGTDSGVSPPSNLEIL